MLLRNRSFQFQKILLAAAFASVFSTGAIFAKTDPTQKLEKQVDDMPFRVAGPNVSELQSKRAHEKHLQEVHQRVSYVLDRGAAPASTVEEDAPATAQ
jgi:hypothetical protein